MIFIFLTSVGKFIALLILCVTVHSLLLCGVGRYLVSCLMYINQIYIK